MEDRWPVAGQWTQTRDRMLQSKAAPKGHLGLLSGLPTLRTTFRRWRLLLDQTFNLRSYSVSHLVQVVDPKTPGDYVFPAAAQNSTGRVGKELPDSPAHSFLDPLIPCPISQGGSDADTSLKIQDKFYISYLLGPVCNKFSVTQTPGTKP